MKKLNTLLHHRRMLLLLLVLQGRRLQKAGTPSSPVSTRLRPGIYIIGDRKVIGGLRTK